MRRAFIVSVAVLAVLAAGCGSSGSSANDKQVAAITRTFNTYFAALKSGDGKTACAQLTPAYQARASRFVTPTRQAQLKGAGCQKALSKGTLSVLQKFHPSLEQVQVSGNRATGFQPAQGIFGAQKTIFRRINGDWKIANTIYTKRSAKSSG